MSWNIHKNLALKLQDPSFRSTLFSQHDLTYLLDSCRSLEDDLNRTARINRIMELYVVYIQEAYFDAGRTVDESYWGEYEVERVSGRRTLILRNYDAEGKARSRSKFGLPF